MQNIKAYLRRATAREYLGCYKEANEGDNSVSVNFYLVRKCVFNLWKVNVTFVWFSGIIQTSDMPLFWSRQTEQLLMVPRG